jgi:hypothetical protein
MSNIRKYAAYYDLIYRDKDYAAEAEYVARLIRSSVPASRAILELGSGTGRHGRLLAAMGFDVHANRARFLNSLLTFLLCACSLVVIFGLGKEGTSRPTREKSSRKDGVGGGGTGCKQGPIVNSRTTRTTSYFRSKVDRNRSQKSRSHCGLSGTIDAHR